MDEYANQPPISEWRFIDQLKSPLHTRLSWRRTAADPGEVSLQAGVSLEFGFPDATGSLDTAYADFSRFLAAGAIRTDGAYRIITCQAPTACFEEYELAVDAAGCRISANDAEGIRRGLVFLEDQITGTGGPFIKTGLTRRTPFIKTRVSRCFFGPIKRPPLNRDELTDDVDYYPDDYLNRLAHEGINGLWLSVEFRDYPSRFFPGHGRDSEKRLEKLRRTVAQCARYGIRIYVYCNEPQAFGESSYLLPLSDLAGNPSLRGHEEHGTHMFCTSSEEGLAYIEECTDYIFSRVPGLGGMICITQGEIPTNCYSETASFFRNNCPRCAGRKPWEVYRDTLAAFARGMKKSSPDASFISWLYTPILADDQFSSREQKFEVLRQIAAHTPPDVTMQMNFESNGLVHQLDRDFWTYDYWLAWPGPSALFQDCARNAVGRANAGASAKIQVGCSHENATIPFMPVPGSLYRKYRAMKELGVSTVMQCWYFGNYPGLMNKAAGELSFLPFAEKEDDFLLTLARADWAGHHEDVARAWRHFMDGYANFPIALSFTWFGPLHCSIAWPLHLVPVDQPIAPSWCFGYPDSGDRIGECSCFTHSLDEVLELLTRMDACWQKGIAILNALEGDYADNADRQMDIGLSKAIGLQIRSALNVYTFYSIREQLPSLIKAEGLAGLGRMAQIVREEIANSRQMKILCLKDPRLGFHSEAEGYKFFPAKLEWRAGLLEILLKTDFPQVEAAIARGESLFPAYTGARPEGRAYACGNREEAAAEAFADGSGSWKAWRDAEKVYFEVDWNQKPQGVENVSLLIEPRRLWPVIHYSVSSDGAKAFGDTITTGMNPAWDASAQVGSESWRATLAIPFAGIPWFDGRKPLRINLCRSTPAGQNLTCWVDQHPLESRLLFGRHNSADLGWLFFPEQAGG